jgi:hypothetical protein
MNRVFDEIFRYLSEGYRYGRFVAPPFPPLPGPYWDEPWEYSRRLDRLITEASEEAGVELRSDARYFLLTNLNAMVLAPLAAAQAQSPEIQVPSLRDPETWDHVRADVVLVLREAGEKRARGASSHRLLDALSRSWNRLWLGKVRIWGEDDDS